MSWSTLHNTEPGRCPPSRLWLVMNAPLVLRTRGLGSGTGGGATRCRGPLMRRLAQQQQHTDLFEPRVRLKNGPTEVAFEGAPAEDITFLDTALERTRNATDVRVS